MNVDSYLERIGYTGSRDACEQTLTRLHKAHLYSVPFENLDIHLGQPIELTPDALFDKIVIRRRGGFCYELNALFAHLLTNMGFRCELLSGRVFSSDGLGPEYDHMLLLVNGEFIADVGFGELFKTPVRLNAQHHVERGKGFRIGVEADRFILQTQDTDWRDVYQFTLAPRRLREFDPMCYHHQTSHKSHFTRQSVCSMPTDAGRVSMTDNRLITTTGPNKTEQVIKSEGEAMDILQTCFGIVLREEADVGRLLRPKFASGRA